MTDFFKDIPAIKYEGPNSTNEYAFRHYTPDEILMGKRMEDHLRFAVAYWHSFAWPGGDPFGGQTFERPWFGETMALAKLKADVAFEMFDILGAPFYAFHDADVRPEGATFADACKPHEGAFPNYYLGILRSAELTGRLDSVLVQLSDYIDRDVEARRKITSALTYPAVIAVLAVVVVVILTTVVLPKFEAFFETLDTELPAPTRLLLGISAWLTSYWHVVLGGLLLVLFVLVVGLRTDRGRGWRDRALLKVPVLGDLLRHVVLERFCRILSSMMQAGVALPEALRVTTEATSNHVYQTGLVHARDAMMRGEGLATPLIETGLFPPSARQMFRVGENTGTLDEQLATAAVYFERELDYKIKRFTNLFEPAVILAMGLVVGFVAVALVSAMYGIFSKSQVV